MQQEDVICKSEQISVSISDAIKVQQQTRKMLRKVTGTSSTWDTLGYSMIFADDQTTSTGSQTAEVMCCPGQAGDLQRGLGNQPRVQVSCKAYVRPVATCLQISWVLSAVTDINEEQW